jgi:hypothetical protein
MIAFIVGLFKSEVDVIVSDLEPRGVAKTINYLSVDFNETFQHIHKELKESHIRSLGVKNRTDLQKRLSDTC